MEGPHRVDREEAVLIVIDVQEGLVKAMKPEVGEKVKQNTQILIALSREMGIPVIVTEQYPKGLGPTVPEVKAGVSSFSPIEKLAFSGCRIEAFNQRLEKLGRKEVILCGIEAHVCVLQTAADLLQQGYGVHVMADAVCSRRKLDWETGLRWMEKKGAMISTTEIIAFQLLKEAGTEEFRRLSKLLK